MPVGIILFALSSILKLVAIPILRVVLRCSGLRPVGAMSMGRFFILMVIIIDLGVIDIIGLRISRFFSILSNTLTMC